MNFVKKSLVGGIKGRIEALERVRVLLLLESNLFTRPWRLASLSYFPIRLAKRLLQELRQAQNIKVIIIKI